LYLVQKIVILFAIAQLCRKQRQGQTNGQANFVEEYVGNKTQKSEKTDSTIILYLVKQRIMPR
jgi:hypothetical protein